MIKQIIKQNGEIEPFSPKKVNGWGEWAAESLGNYVDWPDVVMSTVRDLPETCHSRDLQQGLIQDCLNRNSWSYNRMAGRLYAALLHKDLYGKDTFPTIRQVHTTLQEAGFMSKLNYSNEEYERLEKVIKHKRDFDYAHFQLHHIRFKYALRNRVNKLEMESPQFVFMRMAMALGENRPKATRMDDVIAWYSLFSRNVINAPTPNYVNLGTHHNGLASCCLITNNDTAASIGIADHIAYTMTYMSAGIGHNLNTRSLGDPVRGGLIAHQGKYFYLDRLKGSIRANLQNGRGGACTVYFNSFDPESDLLLRLKNPMTPVAKQIRGMDYNMLSNKFFGRKAARGEDVFTFNSFTAPDLYDAFYSGNLEKFESLYVRYESNASFVKNYVPAREVAITALNEGYETGRAYLSFADEINRHTPYKDPIYSSNLCAEIVEPTRGYEYMTDLYQSSDVGYNKIVTTDGDEMHLTASHAVLLNNGIYGSGLDLKVGDRFLMTRGKSMDAHWYTVGEVTEFKHEPEVALCSLAGLVITNIKNDEEYEKAMYYALLMIDICIHKSTYELPHIGHTAKARMAAAVGMMDLAHYMARKKLKYSSKEGKEEIHRVAERHMYFAIKASLRLGKELGNAPWIHRTKYADGWMPIDTYQRAVDKIVQVPLQYDWEELRSEVKHNKGIRNSSLVAYMPGESSSKASGTVNSIYPARELTIMKTDGGLTTFWAAPHSEKLGRFYELAWDIKPRDLIDVYGIFQKFTDQAISADLYRKIEGSEKITTDEMLEDYFHMMRVGMKTRYYMNTHTAKAVVLNDGESAISEIELKLARAKEIAYYSWLTENGITHGTEAAKKYRAGLGLNSDSEYLIHLYPEALGQQATEEVGCGGGGCTL